MIKPNLTVGSVFEDGGLYYEVQTVLPSGDYISKRIDNHDEEENVQMEIPDIPIVEEKVNPEVKVEDKAPVKRPRTTSRRSTGGRKKQ